MVVVAFFFVLVVTVEDSFSSLRLSLEYSVFSLVSSCIIYTMTTQHITSP